MRTSEEVYHRIRWDPRFDPSRFVLGVGQRNADPERVALPAFTPGGDIPWHRVLFVEADGELVWDRATGLDRVDTCEAGRAREARRLLAPFFTAATPHVWDPAGGWRPAAARARPGPAAARVLTWNTLWDRYDSDRIDTARRRPLLLAALEESDADVLALQEVEPALLAMLLATPWVRAGYTVGTDPYGPDVDDSGLLLLSRLPVREAARHELGPHKSVAAVVVETATGPLTVAVTHLTSDHSADGAGRRRAELARIAEGLAGVDGDLVLLGDFNDGTDTPATALGLRDAWTEAYGADETPTFDPAANPLAALSSRSGRAARLDRILLRGRPRVVSAALRGDTPTPEGLYVSDHYAVEAVLDVTGDDDREPATATQPATQPAARPAAQPVRAPDRTPDRTASTADVTRRLARALEPGIVYVAGSRRMGCELPDADLDLVAALPGGTDPAEVEARVRKALPGVARLRQVIGARVPGLRFRTAGLDVDLTVVPAGSVPPGQAVARRAELGQAAAIAMSAVSDADAVRAAVGRHHARFARLARQVKTWARARGLDSAPFGGLPGLAWTVMAAHTVREGGDLPAGDLPGLFFGTWAAWDWRDPIALGPAAPEPAPIAVLTPSSPVRNCARQVTPGVLDLLTQELYRAWELTEHGRSAELPDPPPLHRRHAAWAVLTVRSDRPEELDAALGRVRGRMLELLAALEEVPDVHAWPHPFDGGPGRARYAIGLGRTPPPAARLGEIAGRWVRGMPGVTVERAECGAVPVLGVDMATARVDEGTPLWHSEGGTKD
ncbi:RNA repair domain-containing protein [Nonomuraea sp. MTCD27]|uniref:RNA repair domain-containing protein n=1 Tax=Nonomuraea sp. MTCD27 TaxID=1676747 RepID=UPI0035BFAF11